MLMEPRLHKPGHYECIWCDCCFIFKSGKLTCSNCGSENETDLVLIHMEDDPVEQAMLSSDNFHGG